MYPIERLQEVIRDWTLTLVRGCYEGDGRLHTPVTEMALSRLFLDTIGQEAGIKKESDYSLSIPNRQTIDSCGLYSVHVGLCDGSDADFNLWVVPANPGEHSRVEFRQFADKGRRSLPSVSPAPLTAMQTAAIAWAVGRLSGDTKDACSRFYRDELEALLLKQASAAEESSK